MDRSEEGKDVGTFQRPWRTGFKCALLCGALLVCTSCGHHQPPTVAVITPTGGLEYWENFDHAVRTTAEAAGINTELAAPQSATDYTEQAQMVENAIDHHVQGIIVSPAHQLVLATVLQKAVAAKISVIIVGSPIALSAKDFSAVIGWDEEEAGRLAARRFVTLLGGKGEVGIVGVSPTAEGSSSIEKAFADEIARSPGVKLVGVKYGLSDWARGRQAILDLLVEHPDLKGILTTDEFATHAACFTFEERKQKRPMLIGISDEVNELHCLQDGRIDALIVSDPRELGTRAMQAMKATLAGKDASRYSTQLPVTIVDRRSMTSNSLIEALLKGPA